MNEEMEQLNHIMIKYIAALKVLETQIEIINDDFQYIKKYNPIEHIKTRIKSADSILAKLQRQGREFTIENVIDHVHDIVGVRIICSFKQDIYDLIKLLRDSNMIKVIKEKDYITNPKDSGYRSYHLIVEVPVELINEKTYVKAEIQIRTLAMDLWASLDHKITYKNDDISEDIAKRIVAFSDEMNDIDDRMSELIDEKKRIEEGDK